jgi:hypothetical protein
MLRKASSYLMLGKYSILTLNAMQHNLNKNEDYGITKENRNFLWEILPTVGKIGMFV